MVKAGKLSKMQILDLKAKKSENERFKRDLEMLVKDQRDQFESMISKEKKAKEDLQKKVEIQMKSLAQFSKENAKLMVKLKEKSSMENQENSNKFNFKGSRSVSDFRIGSAVLPQSSKNSLKMSEFNEIKKKIGDDKFNTSNIVQKDKKIQHLMRFNMKKDKMIVKGN